MTVAAAAVLAAQSDDDKLHVVIAIGGFFGYGAKLISMPFDDLQITAADNDPQVRIKMTGDQIECHLNGKKQLEARDDTFTKQGKVGLWTKADAQTSFDNLTASEVGK